MAMTKNKVTLGTEIPPLVKHVTQQKINLFEACGIHGGGVEGTHGSGQHTDAAAALRSAGMHAPFASGRVQLSFITQAVRSFLDPDAFNHTGTLDVRYLRPVLHGDTITVRGKVAEVKPEGGRTRVTLDVWCENQKGERTSAGSGSLLLPK